MEEFKNKQITLLEEIRQREEYERLKDKIRRTKEMIDVLYPDNTVLKDLLKE